MTILWVCWVLLNYFNSLIFFHQNKRDFYFLSQEIDLQMQEYFSFDAWYRKGCYLHINMVQNGENNLFAKTYIIVCIANWILQQRKANNILRCLTWKVSNKINIDVEIIPKVIPRRDGENIEPRITQVLWDNKKEALKYTTTSHLIWSCLSLILVGADGQTN